MIDIPGWVLVLLAGLGIGLLGLQDAVAFKPRTRTVLAIVATVVGAFLALLAIMVAVGA